MDLLSRSAISDSGYINNPPHIYRRWLRSHKILYPLTYKESYRDSIYDFEIKQEVWNERYEKYGEGSLFDWTKVKIK